MSLAVQGRRAGLHFPPGESQAEPGLVRLMDARRFAPRSRNHATPPSRDKDKLLLLLPLEHHWGRIRLRFQPKVRGEGIGLRVGRVSKAFSKWLARRRPCSEASWDM